MEPSYCAKKIYSLILFLTILFPNYTQASLMYVNPTSGSDLNTGRDINYPLKTLTKAGELCVNNDTIYILGSTHNNVNHDFRRYGNQTGWVYIMPYGSSPVTLNGTGSVTAFWDAILTIESSQKVSIKKINLINSVVTEGIGLRINSFFGLARDIIVDSCKAANVKRQGIHIQGSNTTVKNCEIYNAVMNNVNETGCPNWESALQCYVDVNQPHTFCYNMNFLNNKIYNSWGEGIALVRADTFKVQHNIIYNCYSAYIYMDNSYNGEVNNNWIYNSDTLYNRSCMFNNYRAPGNGIFWAAEGAGNYEVDRIVENIKIHNNFIYGTSAAFGWSQDDFNAFLNNSYRNIQIYYNTVFNLTCYESFYIEPFSGPRNPPSGCFFRNNILPKGRYQNQIRTYFTNSSDYNNYWTITNNCFIDNDIPPGFPNNIQGNPLFINSNYNIPDSFKIKVNSICKDSGIPINGIILDYWLAGRDNTPSIGFHEFGGIAGINLINNVIPEKYLLLQNYPNPFNPQTNIRFSIPDKSFIRLSIFDITGKLIDVILERYISAGNYEVLWNAENFPSGVYFYKLETDIFKETKKMILIK